MRENGLTAFSKRVITVGIGLMFVEALANIGAGVVHDPRAFVIVLMGLASFLVAKATVIAQGTWISFGTRRMSENAANLYRLGYWLMAVGIMATFA